MIHPITSQKLQTIKNQQRPNASERRPDSNEPKGDFDGKRKGEARFSDGALILALQIG